MNHLTYAEAQKLAQSGKKIIFIDVRTPEENALEHIPDSINMPLDNFDAKTYGEKFAHYDVIVTYCNTGNISSQFTKRAHAHGIANVVNMIGGLSVCKECPKITQKGPLPIMRQVQVAAGLLVLVGILLSWLSSPFIGISIFVGAGLVFAGVSGWCGMAKILGKMPWNRVKGLARPTVIHGKNLIIKQFEDKKLAHYSYIAISGTEAVVVDPERDIRKYTEYAREHGSKIIGVMNTHPHADFASGHAEIHDTTGATIYVGDKVGAEYEHIPLKGGEEISFGTAQTIAYFTPGHSPDSISYLVKDADGREVGFFTGDWLFIGDVGRADLRENVGNIKAKQAELAGMMYDTTRTILPTLDGEVMVLPAHGAGTSCGKGLSKQNMATLANQRQYNPMLEDMPREDFISELTSDQPSIPAYFTNSVLLNKKGNIRYEEAQKNIKNLETIPENVTVVDTRTWETMHTYPIIKNAINIDSASSGFIGLLGTIIRPDETYVIIIDKENQRGGIIHEILSIGYEKNLQGIFCIESSLTKKDVVTPKDVEEAKDMVFLDVRSRATSDENPLSENSKKIVNIPLEELQGNLEKLEKNITYVPYCGGAYKSSLAISWLTAHGLSSKKMYT